MLRTRAKKRRNGVMDGSKAANGREIGTSRGLQYARRPRFPPSPPGSTAPHLWRMLCLREWLASPSISAPRAGPTFLLLAPNVLPSLPAILHAAPDVLHAVPDVLHPRPRFLHRPPTFLRPVPRILRRRPPFLHRTPMFLRPPPWTRSPLPAVLRSLPAVLHAGPTILHGHPSTLPLSRPFCIYFRRRKPPFDPRHPTLDLRHPTLPSPDIALTRRGRSRGFGCRSSVRSGCGGRRARRRAAAGRG